MQRGGVASRGPPFYRQEPLTPTPPQFSISTHRFVHLKRERMDAAYKKVNGNYGPNAETEDQGTGVNLISDNIRPMIPDI